MYSKPPEEEMQPTPSSILHSSPPQEICWPPHIIVQLLSALTGSTSTAALRASKQAKKRVARTRDVFMITVLSLGFKLKWDNETESTAISLLKAKRWFRVETGSPSDRPSS